MRFVLPSVLLLAALYTACSSDHTVTGPKDGPERLSAVPDASTTTVAPGRYILSIGASDHAELVVPPAQEVAGLMPLVIMLHGAGGDLPPVEQVVSVASEHGVAVLIPKSRGNTWDAALGTIGEDVVVIDMALKEAFRRVRVDPSRIAIAGFSDGASYALMLGIANGDLFTNIIAFAPGFMNPVDRFGSPGIFIAHGNEDVVTSKRNTEENIVPFLKALNYDVHFHAFTGGHSVNPAAAELAFRWFGGEEID